MRVSVSVTPSTTISRTRLIPCVVAGGLVEEPARGLRTIISWLFDWFSFRLLLSYRAVVYPWEIVASFGILMLFLTPTCYELGKRCYELETSSAVFDCASVLPYRHIESKSNSCFLLNSTATIECIIHILIDEYFVRLQVTTATHDSKHADTVLREYVTVTVTNVIMTFFSSPFSEQSTTVKGRFHEPAKFSLNLKWNEHL